MGRSSVRCLGIFHKGLYDSRADTDDARAVHSCGGIRHAGRDAILLRSRPQL